MISGGKYMAAKLVLKLIWNFLRSQQKNEFKPILYQCVVLIGQWKTDTLTGGVSSYIHDER